MAQIHSIQLEDKSLQWDIFSQRAIDSEVHLRDNKIESIRAPIYSQGYAVRIIRDRGKDNAGQGISGVGIAPGNSVDDRDEVARVTNFAREASKITSAPSYELPSEKKPLAEVKISDPKIEKDRSAATKDLAESVLSLLDKEKDIRLTFCVIRLTSISTKLENCNGLSFEKGETFAYFEAGLTPRSNSGVLSEYWPSKLGRRIEDLKLEENIPRWAKYARDSASMRAPQTGKFTVIFPPYVLAEMAPPIVSFHAAASTIRRKMNRWKNIGEKVWSEKISIVDDGLFDYGVATSPFDDEGTPQQATTIIKNGEFQSYITNNMYAKFVSTKSTGNGVKTGKFRGGLYYSGDVLVNRTNILMDGGDSSLEEMVRETDNGILMEQFSWMLPDNVTGTFGSEIRHAYLIKNGRIDGAIKGGVLNGSFFDENSGGTLEKGIFNSLDLISKERVQDSTALLPFVRVPEMRVSGQ